nr:hypothetical protein Iba_chr11eCG8680 [Ipomoea batatas]GMD58847.1 hypothetical protein Iba_chr11fCG9520 [Ipomoea batatas]
MNSPSAFSMQNCHSQKFNLGLVYYHFFSNKTHAISTFLFGRKTKTHLPTTMKNKILKHFQMRICMQNEMLNSTKQTD